MAVARAGRPAVSGGRDGTVRVWDLATGPPVGDPFTGHGGGDRGGGRRGRAAAVSLRRPRRHGAGVGPGHGPPRRLPLDRPRRRGVGGGGRAWTGGPVGHRRRRRHGAGVGPGRPAPPLVLTGHDGRVHAVAVAELADGSAGSSAAGGGRPAGAGVDSTVRIWDLAGTARRRAAHRPRLESRAVAVERGRADRWSAAATTARCGCGTWPTAPRVAGLLTGHDGRVNAVAVERGRRTPVVVSGGDDGTVRVWDLAGTADMGLAARPKKRRKGTAPRLLTGHDGRVSAVAVSAGGRIAVSGGRDGTLRMWDLADAIGRRPAGWPTRGYWTVAINTAIALAGDTAGQEHALRLNVPVPASA